MSRDMENDQDAKDERILFHHMESFWKRWAPEDRREAGEFHAELHNIVRHVYREAQAPLLKQLNAIIGAMPMFPLVVPPSGKDPNR